MPNIKSKKNIATNTSLNRVEDFNYYNKSKDPIENYFINYSWSLEANGNEWNKATKSWAAATSAESITNKTIGPGIVQDENWGGRAGDYVRKLRKEGKKITTSDLNYALSLNYREYVASINKNPEFKNIWNKGDKGIKVFMLSMIHQLGTGFVINKNSWKTLKTHIKEISDGLNNNDLNLIEKGYNGVLSNSAATFRKRVKGGDKRVTDNRYYLNRAALLIGDMKDNNLTPFSSINFKYPPNSPNVNVIDTSEFGLSFTGWKTSDINKKTNKNSLNITFGGNPNKSTLDNTPKEDTPRDNSLTPINLSPVNNTALMSNSLPKSELNEDDSLDSASINGTLPTFKSLEEMYPDLELNKVLLSSELDMDRKSRLGGEDKNKNKKDLDEKENTILAQGGNIESNIKDFNDFQEGDSHEENDLGGIPQGENNFVEQDETRYKDYIFSNRYKLTEEDLKDSQLSPELQDLSPAEASRVLTKYLEEDPHNIIVRDTVEEQLKSLQDISENHKKKVQENKKEINKKAFGGFLSDKKTEIGEVGDFSAFINSKKLSQHSVGGSLNRLKIKPSNGLSSNSKRNKLI